MAEKKEQNTYPVSINDNFKSAVMALIKNRVSEIFDNFDHQAMKLKGNRIPVIHVNLNTEVNGYNLTLAQLTNFKLFDDEGLLQAKYTWSRKSNNWGNIPTIRYDAFKPDYVTTSYSYELADINMNAIFEEVDLKAWALQKIDAITAQPIITLDGLKYYRTSSFNVFNIGFTIEMIVNK